MPDLITAQIIINTIRHLFGARHSLLETDCTILLRKKVTASVFKPPVKQAKAYEQNIHFRACMEEIYRSSEYNIAYIFITQTQ
jgi:hypothetical protein